MDTEKTYKLSTKRPDTGKWWSYGNMKHNAEYDSWRIGMKVTPELKELINTNDGKYINFSLFADEKREPSEEAKKGIQKLEKSVFDDSAEIPF